MASLEELSTSQLAATFIIYKSNKRARRKVTINIADQQILYSGFNSFGCMPSSISYIDIIDIQEIRKGWKTDAFNRLEAKMSSSGKSGRRVQEEECFSIIYGPKDPPEVLNLISAEKDKLINQTWLHTLEKILSKFQSLNYKQSLHRSLRRQFTLADKDKTKSLTFEECVNVMKKMNIDISEKDAKKLFEKANRNSANEGKKKLLDVNEFIALHDMLLDRPELKKLMAKYSKRGDESLTAEELCEFLKHEQKSSVTVEECADYIKNSTSNSNDTVLKYQGFMQFLLSERQCLFNPRHRKVYQDMTRPLYDYYIDSSHNTYLVGVQIGDKSSIDGYISALKKGCRCVEMDLWDGEDGDPIIKHGYALTSEIRFQDVLRDGIKPYAFKNTPYPLIFSLENHCSVEQQDVVAQHLKNILGDMLFIPDISLPFDKMPSPEQLKNKIVIKAKKLPDICVDGGEETEESEEDDDDDDDDDIDATGKRKKKKKVKTALSKELSDLVWICRSVHFRNFEHNTGKDQFHDIVSISESKAKDLAEDEPQAFINYTKQNMVRIYPKGTRIASGNYNPIHMWNVGCQIVALNYQTHDEPTLTNRAKFQVNGNCGYVLKPKFLSEGSDINQFVNSQQATRLKLKIISGQKLPKPNGSMKGEVIDPYVVVTTEGHHSDKNKFKTETINDNGFNPMWDAECQFLINVPDLAFVQFTVYDDEVGRDSKIGQYIIPFTSMHPGYRHLNLVNENGKRIPHATLFVHVEISDTPEK